MTWGWLKPILNALGKLLGAFFLVKHGETRAEKEQLEESNETARDIAKINNARVADGVDIKRMLRNRRK